MQIDRVADMDQAQINHTEKIKKVVETADSQTVDPNEQYKNANAKDVVKEVNEVILDNIQFGYDKEAKDFFIKITKGDMEYKYPTDEIMRLKAQLREAVEQIDLNKQG